MGRDRKQCLGKIAFVGFGEAACAFVKGWRSIGELDIEAYDIKTDDPSSYVSTGKWNDYSAAGVTGQSSIAAALEDAEIVFSTVTADQALVAARGAMPHLRSRAFFLDCNSCAPNTKRSAADLIASAGGQYVDVAVMAPVHPALHKVPLLLSGPQAEDAQAPLAILGMSAKVTSSEVGTSSTIKMVRSIMVKGLEALFVECVLAGCKAGVDDEVLDSLEDTYPGFEWKRRAAYMLERVMTHGVRRAAELREVALTVDQLGLSGSMARAACDWQRRIGELQLDAAEADSKDYRKLADVILRHF
jgi:3-hydroxyisobutyrate dehydrogenase-like beta-hydroxyacid dehydrogenase